MVMGTRQGAGGEGAGLNTDALISCSPSLPVVEVKANLELDEEVG